MLPSLIRLTRRQLFKVPFAIGAINALHACAPSWTILQQATPNPMVGMRDFALAPVILEGLRVGGQSEAEFLARRNERQRESHEEDKQVMVQRFLERLASPRSGLRIVALRPEDAPTALVLATRFDSVDFGRRMGWVPGAGGPPPEADVTFAVFTRTSGLIDRVELRVRSPMGSGNGRLGRPRALGATAADRILLYLRDRTQTTPLPAA